MPNCVTESERCPERGSANCVLRLSMSGGALCLRRSESERWRNGTLPTAFRSLNAARAELCQLRLAPEHCRSGPVYGVPSLNAGEVELFQLRSEDERCRSGTLSTVGWTGVRPGIGTRFRAAMCRLC